MRSKKITDFMLKQRLLLWAILLLCPVLPAAEISFTNLAGSVQTFWSDANGLPSNRILDVFQDETGYIWLASYEGLIRFDGETFTEITEAEHGFTGISPRVLCEDAQSTLWIGTNTTGLYSYNHKTFRRYGTGTGLQNLSIRAITFDDDGRLWVGTADGLAWREKNGKFVPLLNENGKGLGIITFILPVKDLLFVGSNIPGITAIRNDRVTKLPYLNEIQHYTFSAAHLDADGTIWFGTKDGIIIKIQDERIVERIALDYLKGVSINKFLRTSNGTLYAATDRGIVTLTADKPESFSEDNGLPDNRVSCLCQDIEGNLWIGMEHGGVGKFSKGKFLDLTSEESLLPEAVNSVLEDADKNIWIATDHGITCLQSSTLPPSRAAHIDSLTEMLQEVCVRQIREDADGTLFFATYSDHGLIQFFRDGSTQILSEKDGLPNNRVRFSYRSADGMLWIGTSAGLAVCFNDTVTAFTQEDGLPNLFILCAEQSRDGRLWVGTDGGGAIVLKASLDSNRKPTIAVEHVFTRQNGLHSDIVLRITEDTDGNIWLCTSEGLTLYKDGTLYTADHAIGKHPVSVLNLLQDTAGNFWIITGKDLLLVKSDDFIQAVLQARSAENLVRYNRLDGLPGQLAANAWAHITPHNTLFLPTLKGVAVCMPAYHVPNTHAPTVVIEGVILDDTPLDVLDIMEETFPVAANIKRIVFKFTALSFTIPQRVRFEYKLEGYDDRWHSCGTAREIAYTNLNPGTYSFKVRASNNDGMVNEAGASAVFVKKQFFYQTGWFALLLILCIGAVIFVPIRRRFRHLKRLAHALGRKAAQKTTELADEKEKHDTLLRTIAPVSVIDEYISTGKAKPKIYPAVTVLFADVTGFTEWSERQQPEHIIAQLQAIFTQFDGIMDVFGCDRIKTLGGSYLACCGLRNEKDHATRLVGAAVEMLRSFETINKETGGNFKLKIGIDSGQVTGGLVETPTYNFDIVGETVNTARLLELVTASMACTVSMETAALISERYQLYQRPPCLLNGKGKVPCCYVKYRDPDYTLEYADIERRYAQLTAAFIHDRFDMCKAIIAQLDTSLLEPDMARGITIIQQQLP